MSFLLPFIFPLLSGLAAGGAAAGGIAHAVAEGNRAKEAQENAYKATLNRQYFEAEHPSRGGITPLSADNTSTEQRGGITPYRLHFS